MEQTVRFLVQLKADLDREKPETPDMHGAATGPSRSMMVLPLNASQIGLEWPIEQGGFGVTACTDKAGSPLIGFYPLDAEGKPAGEPTEFAHTQLVLRVVAGRGEGQHVIMVVADAIVTSQGLALRVIMPAYMIERGYDRYLFKPWNATSPGI